MRVALTPHLTVEVDEWWVGAVTLEDVELYVQSLYREFSDDDELIKSDHRRIARTIVEAADALLPEGHCPF